jgi:hypothetical protein
MSWTVSVKTETPGNGDEVVRTVTPFGSYAEALECAEMFALQGRQYLSFNWEEVGPPKWEVNFMGLELKIVIAEVP